MNASQLLKEEAHRAKAIVNELKRLHTDLSQDQLYWKPNQNTWSVVECVEHINTACRHYIPEMTRKIQSAPTNNVEKEFQSGLLGNYLANMMAPKSNGQIKGKMKTLGKFEPRTKTIDLDARLVFDECIDHHKKLLTLIEKATHVDLNKVRVTSAIGAIIRFKLGDCFRFNTSHHERHLLQARNLTKARGFPAH